MVKRFAIWFPLVLFISVLTASCEREITVKLPPYTPKLVVDGRIEQDMPPIVILTKSQGYFDPTDLAAYQNSFVRNAVILISSGGVTDTMTMFCTSTLDPILLPLVAQFTGIPEAVLLSLDICAYVSLNPAFFGTVGAHYALTIYHEDKTYTSTTHIPQPIALDSTYFKAEPVGSDYGFLWARFNEPAGLGNAYRWFTKRLNTMPDGSPKDFNFKPPFGSAFNDEFIDGLTFDFAYARHVGDQDDELDRTSYYRIGDTVVVKFTTIPFDAYQFFYAVETQESSAGSPFAAPSNIQTNIQGGALGLWVGYGITYDTVVFVP